MQSAMYPIEQRLYLVSGKLQLSGHKVCRRMEDRMPESNQDRAANLHVYAAQAHSFAAAAHRRGDDEAAGELSLKAQEYSSIAAEKSEEIARRMPERLRA